MRQLAGLDVPCKLFLASIGLVYALFTLTGKGVTHQALTGDGVALPWCLLMLLASLLSFSGVLLRKGEFLWFSTLLGGVLWIFLTQSLIYHGFISLPVFLCPIYAAFSLYTTWDMRKTL